MIPTLKMTKLGRNVDAEIDDDLQQPTNCNRNEDLICLIVISYLYAMAAVEVDVCQLSFQKLMGEIYVSLQWADSLHTLSMF